MHLQGWDRRQRRARRLFTLEKKAEVQTDTAAPADTDGQLSQAEMTELSGLKQESNSLNRWYQHMRTAACIGLLRPQQLVGVGAMLFCAGSSILCCLPGTATVSFGSTTGNFKDRIFTFCMNPSQHVLHDGSPCIVHSYV